MEHLNLSTMISIPAPGSTYGYSDANFSDHDRQIRLLTLLPGMQDELIRCNLQRVKIEHIDRYEALSYAWGNSMFPHTISVNGLSFNIGENLFKALNHLRLPDSARVLWIDAIYINQSNISERNHQVQQMADIYSRAHQVLVWLGLETETS
jgi:hypothetical protein